MTRLRPEQTVARVAMPYPISSGRWIVSNEFLGSANASPTSGRVTTYPMWISAGTYDALGLEVPTAQSGGSTTCTLGVYAADPTGDAPLTASGPVVSASVSLTSLVSGNAVGVLASTWTVPVTARYWVACSYVAASTPSTVAVLKCMNNTTMTISTPATIGLTTRARGWARTGQTGLPTDAFSVNNWTLAGNTDVPVIGVRRA